MRLGGEKYQSSFYVFEELATTRSTSAVSALICQAVAELHLGRIPEADAALEQVLGGETVDSEAIANAIVLGVLSGKTLKGVEALIQQLKERESTHQFLKDLQEKSDLFDTATAKYSAKVA